MYVAMQHCYIEGESNQKQQSTRQYWILAEKLIRLEPTG